MAERRTLTDRGIKALKPAAAGTRYTLYDTIVPPFGVRVSDKGRKTFVVYRRLAGAPRPVRLALGSYPALTLERAREKAKLAIEDLSAGRHPKEREEARRREEARKRQDTFASVAEEFITRHARKLRSGNQVEAVVRREFIPRWQERPITDITRADIVEMIHEIAEEREAPYMARQALAHLRKLYNWAIGRTVYGVQQSPCDRLSAGTLIGPAKLRDRVLKDDELRLVWRAGGSMGYPFGAFTRMLLITGQRLREVSDMRWSEVNSVEPLWTIPAERMKGDAAHEVPLSRMAIDLLDALPRFPSEYVFTTTDGLRPVSGFSKAKARLDALIDDLRKREAATHGRDATAMPSWRFHDLRRTMRTHLSALPVQDLVRELVIAHRKPGLHRVYDQHAYREEKREALALWGERLQKIVQPHDDPPGADVVITGREPVRASV